jgi:hypothetical protein
MSSIIILTKNPFSKKKFKRMVIEMLLNNDIQFYFFVQIILNFQKEINVIMYYWLFLKSEL